MKSHDEYPLTELSFSEYQLQSGDTAIYPGAGEAGMDALTYTALGLGNEAGEVQGKLKKVMRDADGVITDEHRKALADELGDVLWYASQLASELGYSLEGIARMNLSKLRSRKERNTLSGSGDTR